MLSPMASTESDTQPIMRDSLYLIHDGDEVTIARRYPYAKLTGKKNIRLLNLCPKTVTRLNIETLPHDPTPLIGSLVEVSLFNHPSYECLSYTWGQSRLVSFLWLDGNLITIRDNLYHALISLQHEHQPRLLWVDFVCINQKDLEERKQQVQLMHDIFSSATKVIAFLGDEADGSERIPELLAKVDQARKLASRDVHSEDHSLRDWVPGAYGLPMFEDEIWEALRKFLSRPWFVRVWILQEVLAEKKLDLICGRWLAPAYYVFGGILICLRHRLPVAGFAPEGVSHRAQRPAIGATQVLFMIELGLCDLLLEVPKVQQLQYSLVELLEGSRWSSASDPRDRVFALLNLCKEGREGHFRPNYMETTTETYIRTAEFLVSSGRGSAVLTNAFLADSSLKLPSWVPDWSLSALPFDKPAPYVAASRVNGFPAAGGLVSDMCLGDQQGQLLLTAFRVGEIASLGRIHRYQNGGGGLFETYQSIESCMLCFNHIQPLLHTEDQEDRRSTSELSILADPAAISRIESQLDSIRASRRSQTGTIQVDPNDWSHLNPLFVIIQEIASSLQSPICSKQDQGEIYEIVWRTMVCNRKLRCYEEAPKCYGGYFGSFFKILKCLYEPGYFATVAEALASKARSDLNLVSDIQSHGRFLWTLRQHFADLYREGSIFERAAWRYCSHMRVATTETGFVGMVPHRAQAGDVVVVMKGVCVPIIIRRTAVEEKQFIVVGQAYFHGFMQGEIFLKKDEFEEEIITLV